MQQHFVALRDLGLQTAVTDLVVHETLDSEVIIAEFAYRGTPRSTGRSVNRRNIFVMTIRNWLIAASRDRLPPCFASPSEP